MWMQRVLDIWAANELIHTRALSPESHGPMGVQQKPPGHAAERAKGLHTCFVFTPTSAFSRAKALLLLLGGC